MSGGKFDYKQLHIKSIAEELQELVDEDFRYEYETRDYSDPHVFEETVLRKVDRLDDCTPCERELIKQEVTTLIKELNTAHAKVHALDWYLSGDTGIKTLLEEFKKLTTH